VGGDRDAATGLTLDTGALIAYERSDRRTVARIDRAERHEIAITVPAPCVVEAWRGGARGARLARLLAKVEVESLDEIRARRAGELLGRSGTDDPTDAVVTAGAYERRDVVLTSDPDDIRRLAAHAGDLDVLSV
jgi:predicted nucleic acid-binding protein